MKKRLLHLLLALVLVVCVLPMAVFAADCDHAGALIPRAEKEATCVDVGYTQTHLYCTKCHMSMVRVGDAYQVISSPVIPAKDHTWKNGACTECEIKCQHPAAEKETVAGYPATCYKEGRTDGQKCGVCDQALKSQRKIAMTEHVFGENGEMTKDVTCLEDGIKTIKCSNEGCKATKDVVVPATGHKFNQNHECSKRGCTFVCNHEGTLKKTAEEKAATCYTGAISAGYECSACGYVDEPEALTAALGHKTKTKVTKKATCTDAGEKVITCENCSYTETEVIPVDPDAHKAVVVAGEEATCTETGWTAGKKCERCDDVLEYRMATKALGHDFENGKVTITREASCDKYGLKYTTCARCDVKTEVETFDKLPHNMTSKVLVEASCTKTGSKKIWCADCSLTPVYETIPVQAHTVVDIAEIPASCEKTGVTAAKMCSVCDATLEGRDEIKALGHDYSVDKGYSKAPACYYEGLKVLACSRCGVETVQTAPKVACEPEVVPAVAPKCGVSGLTAGTRCKFCHNPMEKQEVVPALKHEYDDGTVTTEPVCGKEGVKTFKCIHEGCKVSKTEPIAMLLHEYGEGVVTTEATCTTDGVKSFTCIHCGLVATEKIEALGHDISVNMDTLIEMDKEPTCKEQGHGKFRCSRGCKAWSWLNIPTVDHEYVTWAGRPATCEETGRTDGEWCKFCTSENIKTPRTETPALGHIIKLDFASTEPTCTEKGWGRYICEREGCAHTYTDWVPALGHDYEVLVKNDATCTQDGYEGSECKTCNHQIITKLTATGHTEEIVPAVPATCTATGLTEGKKCSTCDAILAAQEEEAILEHAWTEQAGLDATCTADGYTAFSKCSVCGEEKDKTVIEAAHKYEGKKCTVCGAGDPLCKHENAHIEHTNSTCTVAGSEDFYCAACGYQFVEKLPLAAHQTKVESTPATCTTEGLTRKICTVCEQVLESIEIPVASHSYVNGKCRVCNAADPNYTAPSNPGQPGRPGHPAQPGQPSNPGTSGCQHPTKSTFTNPATCTTSGIEIVSCTECKAVVSQRIIQALGHTDNTEVQAATCTKNGVKIVTCDRCDKYEYTVLPATGNHNYDKVSGICSSCRGTDPNRFTKDYQDVFLLDEDAKG